MLRAVYEDFVRPVVEGRACAETRSSALSTSPLETVLAKARTELSKRDIELILTTGTVSETTDLQRKIWAVFEPLMG
jgi:hypothetical protein